MTLISHNQKYLTWKDIIVLPLTSLEKSLEVHFTKSTLALKKPKLDK